MPFDTSTASSSAAGVPADTDTSWRDRLVELAVLAEHGDQAARDEAQTWIATDEQARRAWQEIETTCTRLRSE
jgi:hypothetical protein